MMGAFSTLLTAAVPVAVVAIAVFLFRTRLHAAISRGQELARSAPTFGGAAMTGQARVISVQPIGGTVIRGGHPPEYRCSISLRVQPSDGDPYDANVIQMVDSVKLPNIGPGTTVAVRVDSANPGNVMIDFSQPIRSAAA
jgi:hypothetical protein